MTYVQQWEDPEYHGIKRDRPASNRCEAGTHRECPMDAESCTCYCHRAETVTCRDCGLEPATAGEHGDLCADCYREQYAAGNIRPVGFSSYANDRARRALR